ncbi:MAG: hypothetical protein BWK76_07540 [Desulfobulbaceae bacterium A2]|nr:MAG: hypothetical protein BWK76_07540 [Desulfobulbaceae bacterium A2]
MPCFFVDPAEVVGDQARLLGAEAHHCAVVRRLGPGRKVLLLDGCSRRYLGEIVTVAAAQVTLRLLGVTEEAALSGAALVLGIALLKGASMDLVLEKLTELGVDEIVPLVTEHCENRGTRGQQQQARWQRVLIAACKQCGRVRPPLLHLPLALHDFFPLPLVRQAVSRLVCQERYAAPACAPWRLEPPGHGTAIMLLGPEGGLSPAELLAAQAAGFVPVSLGPQVLRAETAAMAAAAVGLLLLGRLDRAPVAGP